MCDIKKLFWLVVATCYMSAAAHAATVSFNPTSATIGIGESVDVDLIGSDFIDLIDGQIDFSFSSNVDIVSVSVDPYWDFIPETGFNSEPGVWSGLSFSAFFNPPATGDFTIATITLSGLSAGDATLTVLDSSSFFGTIAIITPDFVDASINVIPVPASIWLLIGGLGGLSAFIRKRRVITPAE